MDGRTKYTEEYFCPTGAHTDASDRGVRGRKHANYYCKPCMREYRRAYYQANCTTPAARERKKAYMRTYQAEIDPVTGMRRDATSVSRSPRSYLAHLRAKATTRGKGDVVISTAQLVAMWEAQEGKCAVSGVTMTHIRGRAGRVDTNISLDRIDADKGYEPGNVQLTCVQVNIMKQKLSVDELREWCQMILTHGT